MTIYVDTGESVKTYPLNEKEAKALMTLLESGVCLHWSVTRKGYGVAIVDRKEVSE